MQRNARVLNLGWMQERAGDRHQPRVQVAQRGCAQSVPTGGDGCIRSAPGRLYLWYRWQLPQYRSPYRQPGGRKRKLPSYPGLREPGVFKVPASPPKLQRTVAVGKLIYSAFSFPAHLVKAMTRRRKRDSKMAQMKVRFMSIHTLFVLHSFLLSAFVGMV